MLLGVDYTLGFYAYASSKLALNGLYFWRERTRYWRTWSSKSTDYGRKSYNVGILAGIRGIGTAFLCNRKKRTRNAVIEIQISRE